MRVTVGSNTVIPSPLFVSATEVAVTPDSTPTATAVSARTGASDVLDVAAWTGGTASPITGRYGATLPPQADLDVLTVTWETTIDSVDVTLVDTVRVVKAHYATLPQLLEALKSKAHVDRLRLLELRDDFADLVYEYRGASWTREYDQATVDTCQSYLLPYKPTSLLVSVTDSDDVDVLSSGRWEVTSFGLLAVETAPTSSNPHTVGVEHGVDNPSALTRACVLYVSGIVMRDDSGSGRDIIWQSADGGLRYSTPDWKAGRPTGMLDVDAALGALPDHRGLGVA
jgi:hypothetical protein